MAMKVPSMLADAAIGLLVAGAMVGGMVPAFGAAVGPGAALAVAVVTVAGALVAGRALRRSRTGRG